LIYRVWEIWRWRKPRIHHHQQQQKQQQEQEQGELEMGFLFLILRTFLVASGVWEVSCLGLGRSVLSGLGGSGGGCSRSRERFVTTACG
jgi:hypothetical protein